MPDTLLEDLFGFRPPNLAALLIYAASAHYPLGVMLLRHDLELQAMCASVEHELPSAELAPDGAPHGGSLNSTPNCNKDVWIQTKLLFMWVG